MRARGRIFSKWAWAFVASFLGVAASAETRSFPLAGGEVRLERRAEDTEVFFRAMRLNRATDQWNVDVTVRNRGARPLTGLVLLRFEAPGETAGIAKPDGVDPEGKAFIDLTPRLAKGQLAAGAELPPFTLALAKTARAPKVDAVVFATAATDAVTGSGVTRTLDAVGLPLPGAGAGGVVSERGGWLTLSGGEGAAMVRFDAPGRLPVFRFAATGAGVTELPPPRLTVRAASDASLGGTSARVTPLTPQTLTAPLPLGWSPLAAAFVEFATEPAAPAGTEFTPSAAVLPGEQAVLVRWDAARPAWEVVSLVAGKGTEPVPVTLPGSGAFALVVPDAGVPAAVPGQALPASPLQPPAEQRWTATGKVMPASRPASPRPEQVTTSAQVVFRSTAGALPSGVSLRCAIREEYLLRDGSRRVPPRYETFVTGHQRPGDTEAGTLTASFPLRPLLLLPGEELGEAKLTVEVLAPGTFSGQLLTPAGGTLSDGEVRLVALADVFATPQAARLTVLAPSDLAGVATGGQALVAAFELDLAGVRAGKRLLPAFAAQTSGASFVLARTVFTEGLYGLQPVERFVSDAAGGLSSVEPTSGERLPGVDGGGQYLLLRAPARSALVSGVARDRAGRPAAGLVVRVGPWLAFTDAAGRYQVLAPAGIADVGISDPRTGDTGNAGVAVASDLAAVSTDLDTLPHGPRVLSVAPADGAVDVARVTSVTLDFSRPLDPATLLGEAVKFTDANGAVVPASATLNLARTALTLLPTAQLPANTRLRIALAPTITDVSGLAMEGPREFAFTTESDVLRRADATLVIFEPTGGFAPMVGGPGLAEPGTPVILVNETTGFSSTVLSKPDGSFSNNIPADVDDLLSSVVVNRNGTRNTVPASRQNFRDGRVGLYAAGGSLQASVEDSAVEVEILPGSIRDKAVFKLEPLTSGQVLTATGPTPPSDGRALGGFQLQVTGGELLEPARVRMPVSPSAIKVPAGARPEDMAFVLTRTAAVDGVPVYETVDTARYLDGRLETEGRLTGLRQGSAVDAGGSSPGPAAVAARRQPRKAFVGVYLGIFVFQQLFDVLHANFSVAGGVVQGHYFDLGISRIDRVEGAAVFFVRDATKVGIVPGDRVAFSARDGTFRLPIGLGLIGSGEEVITVGATSQQFDKVVPVKSEPIVRGKTFYRIDLDFVGGNGVNDKVAAGDREAPVVSVSHSPAGPPLDQVATLRVFANDDKQLTGLSVALAGVQPLDAGVPVVPGDVTLTEDPGAKVSLQTIQRSYGIKATKPLTARFEVTAKDAADHTSTIAYSVVFGGPQPPADPPSDPTDKTGPFVTRSVPVQDSEGVLPGQVIRLDFSEPINGLFSPYQPDQVFQLSPATGPVVARLADDRRSVELTYYALQPDTLYSLTVNPVLFDVNGNRFDQNPYNNSTSSPGSAAEAFLLRFRTAPLKPVPLPGVVNGAGVLARGRQLIVLDRVTATQGALHFYDVSDPSQPTVQFSVPVPAFPRAFTLVPNYSYRRLPGAPVETSDLVVAAGGTLGGGGQWLRVFALPPTGAPQTLVATTLSPSPAAAVTKLQWSAPLLGYLEADADSTSVGVLNLQLAIIADQQSTAQFAANPAGGAYGRDANGDGDFVDEGDQLPLPNSALRRLGVFNGGKVATYEQDGAFRQRDFDLQFGGNFLGSLESITGSASANPEEPDRYRTLAVGGLPPALSGAAMLAIRPEGKRLTLLFGQELDTLGGVVVANLALVSQLAGPDTPPRLLVLDVTDPLQPQVVNEIRIPAAHGIPQSIRRRSDGLLVLSTTSDLLLLDPRKLRLVPDTFAQPHPAIVGLLPGFGGGAMQFVAEADSLTARAQGANAFVAGSPSVVDLRLFRPGKVAAPGPQVSALSEDLPAANVFPANCDWDEESGDANRTFENSDFNKGGVRRRDNDVVTVELSRLPASLASLHGVKVRLTAEFVGTAPSNVGFLRFLSPAGLPGAFMVTNGNSLVMETTLPAPFHPLDGVVSGNLRLPLECYAPAEHIRVTYTVFRPDGTVFGEDSVSFISATVAIDEIWSDQFPGAHSNGLARQGSQSTIGQTRSNNGTGTYGDESYPFILMGNRADDRTYVRAHFACEPDIPAVRQSLRFALYRARGRQLVGESTITGDQAAIVAVDDRGLFGSGPTIFAGDERLYLEHFVVAGFDGDHDGVLAADEMNAVFGRAKLSDNGVKFTRLDAFPDIAEEHLKIVNRLVYDNQMLVGILTFLPSGASTLVQLLSLLGGDDEVFSVGAVHLTAFMTGGAPAVLSLEPVGTRDVPDNLTNTGGEGLQNHNVGAFGADGRHHTFLFRYGPGSSLPRRILRSAGFAVALRRILGHDEFLKQDPFLVKARQALVASRGAPTTVTVAVTPQNSGQLFGSFIPGGNGNQDCSKFLDAGKKLLASYATMMSGQVFDGAAAGAERLRDLVDAFSGCGPDEIDLAIGIGGFSLQHLTVTCEVASTAPDYQPGTTPFRATRLNVSSLLRDVYDWDMGINPFAALRSAGNGTLGNGGRIFSYEVPLDGDVEGFEVELR